MHAHMCTWIMTCLMPEEAVRSAACDLLQRCKGWPELDSLIMEGYSCRPLTQNYMIV